MPNEEIKVELKSEAMNEMLSSPPSWLVRSGNGVFSLVLLLILIMTWLIQYPDEIAGPGTVGSTLAPIERSNQNYLQLKKLHVADHQFVKKGDLLAEFDNQANAQDIETAKNYLLFIQNSKFDKQILVSYESLRLGTFQSTWTQMQNQINEWNELLKNNILSSKISSMENEISLRQKLQVISKQKLHLSEEDAKLLAEEIHSTEKLAIQNLVSKQTLAQEKRTQSQSQQTINNQKENYIQNEIALNSLRKDIVQLRYDTKLQKDKLTSSIELSISTLLGSFSDWSKNSTWIAPCDGQVVFNKRLQTNSFYKPAEASLVILPKGTGYIVVAEIPSDGAGKVANGQKALVELIDFPKNEFGMLEGTVVKKASIDKEGKYEVQIMLKNGLETTFHKKIPMRSILRGNVKIITKKKRLLERFFEKILDIIQ